MLQGLSIGHRSGQRKNGDASRMQRLNPFTAPKAIAILGSALFFFVAPGDYIR
jgi:hypothetical protein